jgi:xylan 1,4-beta-xylosidase
MRKLIFAIAIILFMLPSLPMKADGYQNPIIPGYYPDPSICRVGDDFYLVNSTFSYFPGVPVSHSKDLVNWEQIGFCLTRDSQLPIGRAGVSGGIFAPTIRYNDGTFYMVTTNMSKGGNFIVTTKDPAGEWSEPIYIKQGGIDPSLYFEGDKCYFVSNAKGIALCEIDIHTGKQLTETKTIWNGTGGRYPEGPHIFKKDGWYYLMIAEGGTEMAHKETIARSRSIYGPYESNPNNPILTQCDMKSQNSPIQGTGHADIVQAADGSWWLVFLAFRPLTDSHHILGRETCLAPVEWNAEGWPVVNNNEAIQINMKHQTLPLVPMAKKDTICQFDGNKLPLEWQYLRNPNRSSYIVGQHKGFFRIAADTVSLDQNLSPTFVCRRQQHINFKAETKMIFTGSTNGDIAGLTVFMRDKFHYDLFLEKNGAKNLLKLRLRVGEINHIQKSIPLSTSDVYLRVTGDRDMYYFWYSLDGKKYNYISKADTRLLSTETAGGFTGVMLGLFGQSVSKVHPAIADYDWFVYTGK